MYGKGFLKLPASTQIILLVLSVSGLILFQVFGSFYHLRLIKKLREDVEQLSTFSVEELKSRKRELLKQDVCGCYIWLNLKTKRTYVGQSIHVYQRLFEHLNGQGSHSLHLALGTRNPFVIRVLPYDAKRFHSLNREEKCLIEAFHSYSQGYNRTRGNRK